MMQKLGPFIVNTIFEAATLVAVLILIYVCMGG